MARSGQALVHTSKVLVVDRDQVLAFRLASHNLATRLPAESLSFAAGACGVQNTPPGSAVLAFHARVSNLSAFTVERSLVVDKALLQVWSLRASPHLLPTSDAAVFSLGLLPVDEASMRFLIRGAEPALDKVGISAMEVVELTAAALRRELDGCALTKNQLGLAVAARVAWELTESQHSSWYSPSWYAADQSLGESIVRFALPVVALQGWCCHADRRGRQAYLVRTDQWLGAQLAQGSRDQARADLVRRYLHCYGPSTVEHLSEWAGIMPAQAAQMWKLVEDELADVEFGGRQTWLHGEDVASLKSPPRPSGVRFLPAHDPYLQLRDRTTLIPAKALHGRVWRSAGNPGVVLADGQVVGIWQSQKRGKRLDVTVELFAPVPRRCVSEIEAEAATLAPVRGCASAEIAVVSAG